MVRDCPSVQETIQLKAMIEPEAKDRLLLTCVRGRWDQTAVDEAGRIMTSIGPVVAVIVQPAVGPPA